MNSNKLGSRYKLIINKVGNGYKNWVSKTHIKVENKKIPDFIDSNQPKVD